MTVAEPVTAQRATGTAAGVSGRIEPPSASPRPVATTPAPVEVVRYGTECAGHLGLAQGRISAHLARLVSCGLFSQRRAGRRVLYRIADGRTLEVLSLGRTIAQDARRADPGHAGTS